jgi:outer membrane biosynthesis protein TonB
MADPESPGGGPKFVTSGPRARKPRIEVLDPGPSVAAPAPAPEPEPNAIAGARRDEPLVEPGPRQAAPSASQSRPDAREPSTADTAEPLPNFIREGSRPPMPTRGGRSAATSAAAAVAKRWDPFNPRTLLLVLLGLGLLFALFGIMSAQQGREADSAGAEEAVKSASVGFPEDTDAYYEALKSAGDEPVPVAPTEEEQIVAANTEPAPAPGLGVDLPSAAPVPVVRQPAPANAARPREARPEARAAAQAQRREPARAERREAARAAAPEPSEEADSPAGATAAMDTVHAFYSALGQGDGASAARHVVPAKRRSGPLSAGQLTRYFSSMRRPLRVRRIAPLDDNSVRIGYDYVLPNGRLCRGDALVDVDTAGQISRIRTRGPC